MNEWAWALWWATIPFPHSLSAQPFNPSSRKLHTLNFHNKNVRWSRCIYSQDFLLKAKGANFNTAIHPNYFTNLRLPQWRLFSQTLQMVSFYYNFSLGPQVALLGTNSKIPCPPHLQTDFPNIERLIRAWFRYLLMSSVLETWPKQVSSYNDYSLTVATQFRAFIKM